MNKHILFALLTAIVANSLNAMKTTDPERQLSTSTKDNTHEVDNWSIDFVIDALIIQPEENARAAQRDAINQKIEQSALMLFSPNYFKTGQIEWQEIKGHPGLARDLLSAMQIAVFDAEITDIDENDQKITVDCEPLLVALKNNECWKKILTDNLTSVEIQEILKKKIRHYCESTYYQINPQCLGYCNQQFFESLCNLMIAIIDKPDKKASVDVTEVLKNMPVELRPQKNNNAQLATAIGVGILGTLSLQWLLKKYS